MLDVVSIAGTSRGVASSPTQDHLRHKYPSHHQPIRLDCRLLRTDTRLDPTLPAPAALRRFSERTVPRRARSE